MHKLPILGWLGLFKTIKVILAPSLQEHCEFLSFYLGITFIKILLGKLIIINLLGKLILCRGYMAPEYVAHGQLTEKADVYGFGVLLLEIVTGRQNNNSKALEYSDSLLSIVCSQIFLFIVCTTWFTTSISFSFLSKAILASSINFP